MRDCCGFKCKIEIFHDVRHVQIRANDHCIVVAWVRIYDRIIQASRYTYCQCIIRYANWFSISSEAMAKGKPVRAGIMNLNILAAIASCDVCVHYILHIYNCFYIFSIFCAIVFPWMVVCIETIFILKG